MIPLGAAPVHPPALSGTVRRSPALDSVRGLAIVLMLADHLALLGQVTEVRLTLGRLSMPLFFLLSGALVSRLHWRYLGVAALGLTLPVVVPWSGSPNVLLVYALGAVLLVAVRRAGLPVWLLAVVPLALAGNRWELGSTSYDPAALVGIMALGATVGRGWAVTLGSRLPHWLSFIGRAPLRWYVGNVLLIQAVGLWLSKV